MFNARRSDHYTDSSPIYADKSNYLNVNESGDPIPSPASQVGLARRCVIGSRQFWQGYTLDRKAAGDPH